MIDNPRTNCSPCCPYVKLHKMFVAYVRKRRAYHGLLSSTVVHLSSPAATVYFQESELQRRSSSAPFYHLLLQRIIATKEKRKSTCLLQKSCGCSSQTVNEFSAPPPENSSEKVTNFRAAVLPTVLHRISSDKVPTTANKFEIVLVKTLRKIGTVQA